uniref:Protein kinase domain-containing protein n=1 Tax=Hydatigena taeniaeformis TaxID=6205 RepID=A0A0R3WPS4_HYDTA
LTAIERFGKGCDQTPNKSLSIQALIKELNACERNSFLRLWISPTDNKGTIQVVCSRSLFVVFDEVIQLIRLPSDVRVIELFAKVEKFTSGRSPFDGLIEGYGKLLLKSNYTTLRMEDEKYRLFDATLRGNVSLDCQSSHVVACVYGPLFQLELVHMSCFPPELPGASEASMPTYASVGGFLVLPILLRTGSCLWRHRYHSRRHCTVWRRVETYTKSLLLGRHLRTPPLPTPLLGGSKNRHNVVASTKEVGALECAKLRRTGWLLSARSLRLEGRIASGRYGDVVRGVLLASLSREKHEPPRPIVAKMLNGAVGYEC